MASLLSASTWEGWGAGSTPSRALPTLYQEEFEDLQVMHREEKQQLEELKQRHQVLAEEFSQIQAERAISSKKRLEAEREMLRMVRAATLIQAVWKGYLVRSMLRSKKKKRGKGKDKGKGKK